MFFITLSTIALAAASSVVGLVVPRYTAPASWKTSEMEPYDNYHTRYLALDCYAKHGTPFFDQCCHPIKADQTLATAHPGCPDASSASVSNSTSTDSSGSSMPTATVDSGADNSTSTDTSIPSATATSTGSALTSPNNGSHHNSPSDGTDSAGTPADDGASATSTSTSASPSGTADPDSSDSDGTDDGDDCDEGEDDGDDSTTADPSSTTSDPSVNAGSDPSTSTSAAPAASSAASSSGDIVTGGFATFFFQNGVAGACGTVHQDTDLIAAIDADRYGDLGAVSPLCGQQVQITNTNNQKTVTVTIADACPTCDNSNSIDLSQTAFDQIADASDGIVPISWSFA